jgi:hypothetical protein
MQNRKTPIERAFALAKSGEFSSVGDIRKELVLEGYDAYQITGPSLLKQLRVLIRAAQVR